MFAEDLAPFFNTDDGFAQTATLDGAAVVGIFDNAYVLEDLGGGVSATAPAFTLASASVPSPVAGLLLVVGGNTYKVAEPIPDGTGVTTLRLRT